MERNSSSDVCQQANYADNLMLGAYEAVDRTTVTVP